MWRSQTFENDYQGGYLLVVPGDLLPHWPGKCPLYDQLCEFSPGPIDYAPIADGFAVLVSGPEGDIVHEAWWVRTGPQHPLVLAAWNEWGTTDRDAWLAAQLGRADLAWARHGELLRVDSGELVVTHGEDGGTTVVAAAPGRMAQGGEYVAAAVAVGRYAVETAEIEERPDGEHCVELVRFIPVATR